jgi:hypothetical protein
VRAPHPQTMRDTRYCEIYGPELMGLNARKLTHAGTLNRE